MRPIVAAALVLAAGAATAIAADPSLTVGHNDEYDAFVATGNGRPLYAFAEDIQGGPEHPAVSDCYDVCAEMWPPMLAGEGEPAVGAGLDPDLLGTTERRDGSRQITYDGWPLYRYFRDERPAFDTHGQSLHTQGGSWYLLRPSGEVIQGREL